MAFNKLGSAQKGRRRARDSSWTRPCFCFFERHPGEEAAAGRRALGPVTEKSVRDAGGGRAEDSPGREVGSTGKQVTGRQVRARTEEMRRRLGGGEGAAQKRRGCVWGGMQHGRVQGGRALL